MTRTIQTVAQQCELLDSGEYMETETEQPVAYSQKHDDPSESEVHYTRTPLMDVEETRAKINRAILTSKDNICVHDVVITTDFNLKTVFILNPKFKTIPQDVQKVLFHILGDTVKNMILALSAGMQSGLINKTIAA